MMTGHMPAEASGDQRPTVRSLERNGDFRMLLKALREQKQLYAMLCMGERIQLGQ
jgi:hypothetical protein